MAAELAGHETFFVVGHTEPDGDCIASQLVVSSLLRRLNKTVYLLNQGPFTRPEIAGYAGAFLPAVPAPAPPGEAVAIYLDCSTPDRVGTLADGLKGCRSIVVDHHASGTVFGDVRLVDPARPSVTLLVLDLMEEMSLRPTSEEARLILLGLCTDTAFFRHLGHGSAAVFAAVARLVDTGVSPAEVFQAIYGHRGLEERRKLGLTLSRSESLADGRIVFCRQTLEERSGGTEEIYRLLQTVEGVRVIILVREEAAGEYSVSLRSLGDIDVGRVARSLGGGGHAPAAGCTLRGSADEVKQTILAAITPLVQNAPPPV